VSTEHFTAEMTGADKGVEKWFPGKFLEALRTFAKLCHCPKEILGRNCCVNRYKVTYFCVMKQFRVHLEAGSIIILFLEISGFGFCDWVTERT
jgi:hypothetical protein